MTTKTALIALALMTSGTALAGESRFSGNEFFDRNRYHLRQDACVWKDRIAAECARGHCDDLALRQATRDCSAFGPLGDRRSPTRLRQPPQGATWPQQTIEWTEVLTCRETLLSALRS